MKNIFYVLLCLLTFQASAQNFEISGKILDSENNQPLEAATVYLERPGDSTLVSYTISENDGDFILTGNTSAEILNLLVSFTGYQPYKQIISLAENRVKNIGNISLSVADNTLDEITLIGERAPVTIKRDTLEFNAASFATRPDANLEELMKKLPGVEVDTQGNITVNGKPVSRILVDGKEFFGNDPKIATKNLPKDIIDKIQVTDTKTRSQEFTGKAGNPDDQTINITIQKDKNKGYFARATAGGGTDDRYELSGIGNYFKDKMRISVLASSNNINSSGFSFDEVFDMMGRNARSFAFNSSGGGGFGINGMNFGGGGGITKAETAGMNYVDEWGKELNVNADYFFGRNDTETRTVVERENILPDSRFFYNSTNASNLVNDSHRANARIEFTPDTLTRISVAPRFNTNTAFSNRTNSAISLNEDRELVNSTETIDEEQLESISLSNRLDVIRRYGSRGAYSQLNFTNSHQRQENENFFFSESRFMRGEEVVEIQDQFIDENQNEDQYSVGLTQRFVLANKFYLDASYDFTATNSGNTRSVYDYDAQAGSYSNFNTLLSSDFESKSQKNIPNAGLNYEGAKWRLGTEVGLLNTTLETTNYLQEGSSFSNSYNNLFLSANVRYEITRSKSIYINYNSDAGIPSIRQLQPVVNRTNPLNIFVGNPDLRPTYTQTIRGGFRNYDFSKRSGFFSYGSVTFTDNSIVPVTTTGADLVRTTTYTNVDGAINANAGASVSKQYKRERRELSYRFGLNGNYDKNVGFTNGVLFNSERYTIRPSVNLTWGIEDYFSFNPGYQLAYTESFYDINASRNENFTNHTVSLEATTFWPKNFVFGNDISYTYFGNLSPGFDNTAFLWNISLGYKFLKDNATVKIKVYDMLNENVSNQRIVGDDFIQDTENLILRRYAMLSFTYKISKFGGQDPNARRGGVRMMRM